MLQPKQASVPGGNFNAKNVQLEMVRRAQPLCGSLFVAIENLEAMRTHQEPVPASKHQLEVICGASCETGAQ
jgi:hypothetical protein